MLQIDKRFFITTKIENHEMLCDYLELATDAVIEGYRYNDYSWDTYELSLVTLECVIDSDKFDQLVEGLKRLFKDQKAIISY